MYSNSTYNRLKYEFCYFTPKVWLFSIQLSQLPRKCIIKQKCSNIDVNKYIELIIANKYVMETYICQVKSNGRIIKRFAIEERGRS